jgi:XRE family transcriptional regulator, aerobic/anaerobic benzoate catabolism transcriptional regulator
MSQAHLLQALGRRLRALRESSQISLQTLSDRASVSRRFLVEIEAGRANPSVAKLAALSDALGISLSELCDLPLARRRPSRYALIGMRGAGKSTLGVKMALELEVPFCELDQLIEQHSGLVVAEIFELEGTTGYRRRESKALEAWLSHHGTGVLAVPGGIVGNIKTYDRLLRTCHTIWLQASPEDHWDRVLQQGDTRPMRGSTDAMASLRQILAERVPAYARAEIHLQTSGATPEESLKLILEQIQESTPST